MATPEEVEQQLSQEWTEKEQLDDLFEARAQYEGATNLLFEAIDHVEGLIAEGTFDTLAAAPKQGMLSWRTILKDCKTAIENDAAITAIRNWRPEQ